MAHRRPPSPPPTPTRASTEVLRTLSKTPIPSCQIYDACIQHGCDGAAKIASQASSAVGGGPRRVGEGKWLKAYFAARKGVLAAGGELEHMRAHRMRLAGSVAPRCYNGRGGSACARVPTTCTSAPAHLGRRHCLGR